MPTAFARTKDFEIFGDLRRELMQGGGNFLAAERGEALQAQIENAARLCFRQAAGPSSPSAWRGSAISATNGAMSLAGQARAIKASRAAAASGDERIR